MSVKILSSSIIGLEQFFQDSATAIAQAESETVTVFDNNQPIFYALSSARLSQLLAAEAQLQNQSAISLEAEFFDEPVAKIKVPAGKFALYAGWQPDTDFLRQAALWGIALGEPVTDEELAAFIAYWQAEGRIFHQVQWQQKLARHLQLSRGSPQSTSKRDITQVAVPDHNIPNGFRGE
ncbi:primosomal protein DnaT [Tatumella sp. TA1]|uniref:primosomal protein DnaT n=1 Tax=Rosenbergiella collisarenosi TaxID=1544695 RepID=UPI0008F868A0|nr:primosomal protein DnaT [Rosenbergiella collisarenosi]MBT0722230.1 primosomal protein DnaT [Rosenbergiella collisarenosi]QGX90163.1 primosomal protein DnaT [Tatumella sp. TA1]